MDNEVNKPESTPKPEATADKTQNNTQKPNGKSNNNVIVIVLVVVGVLVVLGSIGTFVAGKLLNKAGKSIVENATNTKITTNKDGTSTIESKDGSVSYSDAAKLPTDFPKNIPLYSGQKLTGSSKVKNDSETTWTVTAESSDEVSKVAGKVASLFSGWESTGEQQINDTYYYYFEKGNTKVNLYLSSNDEKKTVLTYQVTEKQSNE